MASNGDSWGRVIVLDVRPIGSAGNDCSVEVNIKGREANIEEQQPPSPAVGLGRGGQWQMVYVCV